MKFRLDEDINLLEWGNRGQGVVCRTLIQILKLIGIEVPDNDWVLHHKNGKNRDENLENLLIMTRSDHSRFHKTKDKNSWKPNDDTYDVKALIDEFIERNDDGGDDPPSGSTARELVGSAK